MEGLSAGALLLIGSCVVPWLLLELVFFVRMKKRHGASASPVSEPGAGDSP